jgi:MFS family permease
MNDAINRAVERQARRVIRIEQWLVVIFFVSTVVCLAAALYFEKTYGVPPYSFVFALVFFGVSAACFWALFSRFRDSFRHRSQRKGMRAMFGLASIYMVIASLVAYAIAFGLFGLRMPWTGEGRDYLYLSYFLLSASAIFLARSATFYWKLRSYIVESLGNLIR